jgi:hypothetical protein
MPLFGDVFGFIRQQEMRWLDKVFGDEHIDIRSTKQECPLIIRASLRQDETTSSLSSTLLERSSSLSSIEDDSEVISFTFDKSDDSVEGNESDVQYLVGVASQDVTIEVDRDEAAFRTLRWTYLLITLVIMLADGLQGMFIIFDICCSLFISESTNGVFPSL